MCAWITGITDEMVAGHKIDEASVNAFVDDSVVVIIAHNSGFDRKFVERYWPVFERKAWACSATEVDWRQHGFDGTKLGYLLNGAGYFHQAHRAVDDCHALLEILDFDLPTTGAPALAVLLDTARRKTVRIWAEQSPLLRACAKHDVVVEINAHPWRLDLDWRWHQVALEFGCMLSINPDAHSIAELDHMHWGVEMARKGGVPAERVLNALPLAEITRHLKRRRRTLSRAA
jgi:DNA polymerase III epsilon subunit-like protein